MSLPKQKFQLMTQLDKTTWKKMFHQLQCTLQPFFYCRTVGLHTAAFFKLQLKMLLPKQKFQLRTQLDKTTSKKNALSTAVHSAALFYCSIAHCSIYLAMLAKTKT